MELKIFLSIYIVEAYSDFWQLKCIGSQIICGFEAFLQGIYMYGGEEIENILCF